MRERGSQSRRSRVPDPTISFRPAGAPPPPSRSGGTFWPALAIAAIIAATAGWTTVAIMLVNGGGPATSSSPTGLGSLGLVPSDSIGESDSPEPESHLFPDLEALLPPAAGGSTLDRQSWTGDLAFSDDSVSTAMAAVLTAKGKTDSELHLAQAFDLNGNTDLTVSVFTAPDVDPAALRDAVIAALKGDDPTFKTTTSTIASHAVTVGTYTEGDYAIYWYVTGPYLFSVETADKTLATAVVGGLSSKPAAPVPTPAASGSGAASASAGTSPSAPAATPSVPASASPSAS